MRKCEAYNAVEGIDRVSTDKEALYLSISHTMHFPYRVIMTRYGPLVWINGTWFSALEGLDRCICMSCILEMFQ